MSFVVWAALAIAGLVALPIVAHLLRRGRAKEREFPPAALVPPLTSTARERSRLEDYPLLALRSALVVGLALLGAMPLVRCERLSLARASGASVALAIVLDDSLSMRSNAPSGVSRWELALGGAEQLLGSAREGDAIAIVLAGRPARIALSPTTNVDAARRALRDLHPSDRSTDLAAAVQLARTAIRAHPQKDHRVVVLSDLAGEAIPEGTPPVDTPLPELAGPAPDCGITTAERHGARVSVSVACSSEDVARNRGLEVVVTGLARERGADAGAHSPAVGDVVGHAELSPRRGEQTLVLGVESPSASLDARLTGHDAEGHDDAAPVSDESAVPAVAVVADAVTAGAKTGGPTVIEQALAALGDTWLVRPLELSPDDEKGYSGVEALVLDDPRGLSPDARAALERYLTRGGVALALLGPRGTHTEIGWTLEPFSHGALRWEPAAELGLDPSSLAWLGPEAGSLGAIGRRGRARLDGTEMEGARVVGRWTDGLPFLLERHVGRGLCFSAGLPASLDESDLAVRPGFLALLDHVLGQADQRKGLRRTLAGIPWTFPDAKHVSVTGPEGPVPIATTRREEACADPGERCEDSLLRALPSVRGRYVVRIDDESETRTVIVEAAEILAEPRPPTGSSRRVGAPSAALVSASREVSLVLLALLLGELALRLARRWATRPSRTAPS